MVAHNADFDMSFIIENCKRQGLPQETVDQEPVNLTLKEYEMLVLLLKNSGMVLSRTQLLNQIWGYEFDGESRTVDVHIRTLRQKLGSAGDLIETVRGVGYKIGR